MPTDTESQLREKLRKIEALFAGAATRGEKAAAGAAAERIRARLKEMGSHGRPEEMRINPGDAWGKKLFTALCRRYGVRPYRYPRMHRNNVVIKVPREFFDTVLWPEFRELNAALREHLEEVTEKIIRSEVYGDTSEAEEVRIAIG